MPPDLPDWKNVSIQNVLSIKWNVKIDKKFQQPVQQLLKTKQFEKCSAAPPLCWVLWWRDATESTILRHLLCRSSACSLQMKSRLEFDSWGAKTKQLNSPLFCFIGFYHLHIFIFQEILLFLNILIWQKNNVFQL